MHACGLWRARSLCPSLSSLWACQRGCPLNSSVVRRLYAMESTVVSAQPLEAATAQLPPSPSAASPASAASSPHKRRLDSSCALLLRDQSTQYRGQAFISALLSSHGVAHSGVSKQVPSRDAFILFADEQQRAEASARMQTLHDQDGKRVFRSVRDAADWTERGRRRRDKRAKSGGDEKADEHKENSADEAAEAEEAAKADEADDARQERKQQADSDVRASSPEPDDQQQQQQRAFGSRPAGEKSSASIVDVVTPYHSLPYDTQLRRKQRQAAAALKQALKAITALDPTFTPFRASGRHLNSPMLCDLDDTLPSPVLTGYRNKCEFSFGRDRAGRRCVGFLLGRFTEGLLAVEAVDGCVNVSSEAKAVARGMTEYVQHSAYECYDKMQHTGVWRLLTVRQSSGGQLMVVVQLDASSLSAEQLSELHASLVQHFTTVTPVHSLYAQHHSGISNAASSSSSPPLLLHGAPVIVESLCSLSFRISPSSFFQTNTRAAETLYATVRQYCSPSPSTVLLDVCCGTGTIGQVLAPHVRSVIGLELEQQAVHDAQLNADLNALSNARYVCGRVEETMAAVLQQLSEQGAAELQHVVAVVDPPRSGLHGSVLRLLRDCSWLRRIVYVSCNPKTLTQNLVVLCQRESKRVRGQPFICKRAVPVDMFPHTDHCEMIVLMERE